MKLKFKVGDKVWVEGNTDEGDYDLYEGVVLAIDDDPDCPYQVRFMWKGLDITSGVSENSLHKSNDGFIP